MVNQALIIFVRNPVLGKVKTRLAASIGKEKALEIYRKLLHHTWEVVNNISASVFVFISESLEDENWRQFTLVKQEGDTLGEKMSHAFQYVFDEGYKSVVIIGSDCPELLPAHISEAFKALNTNNLVLGPARDGGYYLLGMQEWHAGIFEDIPWSSSRVFEETLQKARRQNFTIYELERLSDLDVVTDLPANWIEELNISI